VYEFRNEKPVRQLAKYTEATFKLDDNSLIRIALCDDCHNFLKPADVPYIMESIKQGWIHDANRMTTWTPEKKKNYIDTYMKRDIVSRHDIEWDEETIQKGKENR
jgi:uncharacterized protein YlaI